MKESDFQIKIDDVIQLQQEDFEGDEQKWIDESTFLIVESNIQQSGCISIKSVRNDLDSDYYLRYQDENLILDRF